MPETAEDKKKRERDEMLAALRRNQTKVSTAEEGSETYQEGEAQGYGTQTRRTLKMSGASPSPSPSPSGSPRPSPSPSASSQAGALRSSPGASPYDSMSEAELALAAKSSPLAAAALQRRKKAAGTAGGQ